MLCLLLVLAVFLPRCIHFLRQTPNTRLKPWMATDSEDDAETGRGETLNTTPPQPTSPGKAKRPNGPNREPKGRDPAAQPNPEEPNGPRGPTRKRPVARATSQPIANTDQNNTQNDNVEGSPDEQTEGDKATTPVPPKGKKGPAAEDACNIARDRSKVAT